MYIVPLYTPTDERSELFKQKKMATATVKLTTRDRDELVRLARKVQTELEKIAKDLDDHLKSVNIARISGGAAGVIGAGMALVGIIGIPFTLGFSGVLVGGGAALGTAGTATSLGAQIKQHFFKKDQLQEASKLWRKFSDKITELFGSLPSGLKQIRIVLEGSDTPYRAEAATISGSIILLQIMPGVAADFLSAAGAGVGVVTNAAKVAGALGRASALFPVISLGAGLFDIIDGSIDIAGENGCKGSDNLREFARQVGAFAKQLDV